MLPRTPLLMIATGMLLTGACNRWPKSNPTAAPTTGAAPVQTATPAPAVTSRKMVMAERAAQLDAYRKLLERIEGFQISSSTSVRDFITEHDVIRKSMEGVVRGARLSPARYYTDASCEVDAELTTQQVVDTMTRVVTDAGGPAQPDFEKIERRVENKTIKVTGFADATDAVPEGEPLWSAGPPRPRIFLDDPAGTKNAMRVAETSAYRLLIERLRGLPLTSRSTVQDFIAQNTDIETAFSSGISGGLRRAGYTFRPEGIVELRMEVTIEQVVATLQKVCIEKYKGEEWRKNSFDELLNRQRKIIAVTGRGPLTERGDPEDNPFRPR